MTGLVEYHGGHSLTAPRKPPGEPARDAEGWVVTRARDAARAAVDASTCRCGNPMLIRHVTYARIVSCIVYCRDRKWWNPLSWLRHDPDRTVYQYSEGSD